MSDIWYFAEGEETRGPVRREELIGILRQVSDPLSVKVWRSDFDDWVAVSRVSELADHLVKPPPHGPSVEQPQPTRVREPVVTVGEAAEFRDVKPELTGIGGWLTLVAIGQVLGPLRNLGEMAQYYGKPENKKAFETFPLGMYGELALNIGLVVIMIYTAVLFFKKSRSFPHFFIIEWIAIIVLPFISYVWASIALALQTGKPFQWIGMPADTAPQLVAAVILATIGSPTFHARTE